MYADPHSTILEDFDPEETGEFFEGDSSNSDTNGEDENDGREHYEVVGYGFLDRLGAKRGQMLIIVGRAHSASLTRNH